MDYILFSDSAVKAATNQQQWYVTISRGRKGVRIFTSDKAQLRENITQSGDRKLAMDLADRRLLRRIGFSRKFIPLGIRVRDYASVLRRRLHVNMAARRRHAVQQKYSTHISV